jgi:hypothetical protein
MHERSTILEKSTTIVWLNRRRAFPEVDVLMRLSEPI